MAEHYDTEMIRDFLRHLLWELRIKHWENTHRKGEINDELVGQLKACMDKRGMCALLPDAALDHGNASEQDIEQATRRLRQISVSFCQAAIEDLEAVEALLENTLDITAQSYSAFAKGQRLGMLWTVEALLTGNGGLPPIVAFPIVKAGD